MRGKNRLRSMIKDAGHAAHPRGGARALVIVGCQRSGTNALAACFEDDWNAKVFHEHSALNVRTGERSLLESRRYSLRLLPLGEVAMALNRTRYPLVVLKPLVESQNIAALLEVLPRSRAVWLFRYYLDVAESNARVFGPDVHRRNLEPIAAGDSSNWRSEGVSEEVREFVAEHYRADMRPIDGGALFWWARNRLLFDRGVESDPRLTVLDYGRFVEDPEDSLAGLYAHSDVPFPGPKIADSVTRSYVGRGSASVVSAPIREQCEELWSRLLALEGTASRPLKDASG